jgi:hypothetical protein
MSHQSWFFLTLFKNPMQQCMPSSGITYLWSPMKHPRDTLSSLVFFHVDVSEAFRCGDGISSPSSITPLFYRMLPIGELFLPDSIVNILRNFIKSKRKNGLLCTSQIALRPIPSSRKGDFNGGRHERHILVRNYTYHDPYRKIDFPRCLLCACAQEKSHRICRKASLTKTHDVILANMHTNPHVSGEFFLLAFYGKSL